MKKDGFTSSRQKPPWAWERVAWFAASRFIEREKVAGGVWILAKYSDKVTKLATLLL